MGLAYYLQTKGVPGSNSGSGWTTQRAILYTPGTRATMYGENPATIPGGLPSSMYRAPIADMIQKNAQQSSYANLLHPNAMMQQYVHQVVPAYR